MKNNLYTRVIRTVVAVLLVFNLSTCVAQTSNACAVDYDQVKDYNVRWASEHLTATAANQLLTFTAAEPGVLKFQSSPAFKASKQESLVNLPSITPATPGALLPGWLGDPNHTTHVFAQIANVWLDPPRHCNFDGKDKTPTDLPPCFNPYKKYHEQMSQYIVHGEGIQSRCINLADATFTLSLRNNPDDPFRIGDGTLTIFFATHFGGKKVHYVFKNSSIHIPPPKTGTDGWKEFTMKLSRDAKDWDCLAPSNNHANIGNEGLISCHGTVNGFASWDPKINAYRCSGTDTMTDQSPYYGCGSNERFAEILSTVDLDMGIVVWKPIPPGKDQYLPPQYPTGTLQIRGISIKQPTKNAQPVNKP
jgi:hypothetical protein